LAALSLFVSAVDAYLAGDSRQFRAASHRLWLLGWRIARVDEAEGGGTMRRPHPTKVGTIPVADPDRLRVLDPPSLASAIEPAVVPRLLWGWPEIPSMTGIPRSTLERLLAAGKFPKPVLRVGRRPFWKPADVIRWAEGGKP
jgi:predicted DNA-binding transcriptional regulator AlpA